MHKNKLKYIKRIGENNISKKFSCSSDHSVVPHLRDLTQMFLADRTMTQFDDYIKW